VPSVGVSRPASKPNKVDLPDPEVPSTASEHPFCTVKLTSSRMVNTPVESATRLVRWVTSMAHKDVEISSIEDDRKRLAIWLRVLRLAVLLAFALFAAPVYSASKTLLVLGDSLSAEYGLVRGTGWVPLLQARLKSEKIDASLINASISGETTSGGRSRLQQLL